MKRNQMDLMPITDCLEHHILLDVSNAYETVNSFLDETEVAGEVAQNLLGCKKRIGQSMALLKAVIAASSFLAEEDS